MYILGVRPFGGPPIKATVLWGFQGDEHGNYNCISQGLRCRGFRVHACEIGSRAPLNGVCGDHIGIRWCVEGLGDAWSGLLVFTFSV